jgi:hypothetical protein
MSDPFPSPVLAGCLEHVSQLVWIRTSETGTDIWILMRVIYWDGLWEEGWWRKQDSGAQGRKLSMNEISAGDLTKARIIHRADHTLIQGASLLEIHLNQSLTASCSPGRTREQFTWEGAAVSSQPVLPGLATCKTEGQEQDTNSIPYSPQTASRCHSLGAWSLEWDRARFGSWLYY